MSLDTEAPIASVSAAHLYTMPDTGSVHRALDLEEALDYLSGFTQPRLDGAFGGCAPYLSPSLIDIARTHAPTLSLAASQGRLAVLD